MTNKRFILLSIFVFIFSFSSFGQSTSISGTVSDQTKAPIPGATVILRNKDTGFERVSTTDNDGTFLFDSVNGTTYTVSAVAPGFARSADTSADNVQLQIMLEPAAIEEAVTVVTGSRQEELRESLTTKVDVLTRSDIETNGSETVGEILREIPGVITRRGSETTPPIGEQVQGIDSRQILVLMDGQPVTGGRGIKSGIINLDRQQIGQLESIEVVKGASSALYGSDAIGGVINLRTRVQTKPFSASVSAAGGNFGVFDTTATTGFLKDKLSGFFTLGRHKNNGFDLFPADFTTDGSGFHRYDAYGKLTYKFTDNFSLSGFANSYWNNSGGKVVGEPTDFVDLGRQIIDVDDESQNYGLTAEWTIDGQTHLQARGYFSRFDEVYRAVGFPSRRPQPDGNLFERYSKFDAMITRFFGERHLLQAGVEFANNRYNGFFRLQNDEGEANTQVVWAQDRINLLKRLTLTIGGRLDHHSVFGTAVSPKIGLNYKLADFVSLRASWGRGFRAPDLGQLFYNFRNPLFGYQILGNQNLSPEHSGSWQVGAEFNGFARKARLGINFFRNDVRNLINSVQLGTPMDQSQAAALLTANGLDAALTSYIQGYPVLLFAYKNIANVYTQGVEADASYLLPFGFSVNGGYTFLEAEDEQTGRFLTGRHKHHGSAKVAYTNRRYGITGNFRGTFYGKWWATNTRKAVGFELFDIYAAKELPKGFSVYGTVDNLFNSQDPNTGLANPNNPLSPLPIDRADAGRTFRIGIKWNLDRNN